MPKHINRAGLRFLGLVVMNKWERRRDSGGTSQIYWKCRCDCGKTTFVSSIALGKTQSCGCSYLGLQRNLKHGLARSPEYVAWVNMKQRCGNKRHPQFDEYGKRGIKVCKRWKKFENFIADMGRRPSPKHSLDRIDNNGNYEPNNCRWTTSVQQNRNTRASMRITFDGQTMTATAWAAQTGIAAHTIRARIHHGWPVAKALTKPIAKK